MRQRIPMPVKVVNTNAEGWSAMALMVGDAVIMPGQEVELEPNEEGVFVIGTKSAMKAKAEKMKAEALKKREEAKAAGPQYMFKPWETPLTCSCPPAIGIGPNPCCLVHVKGLSCTICPPSCSFCCITCPPQIKCPCPTCPCPTCTCCPPSCTWCDITCPPKCCKFTCCPPSCECCEITCPPKWCKFTCCPPSCTCCDITCPPKCTCLPDCCGTKTVGIECIIVHCTTTMYPKCLPACLCCGSEVIDGTKNNVIFRGTDAVESKEVKVTETATGGPAGEEMQR